MPVIVLRVKKDANLRVVDVVPMDPSRVARVEDMRRMKDLRPGQSRDVVSYALVKEDGEVQTAFYEGEIVVCKVGELSPVVVTMES